MSLNISLLKNADQSTVAPSINTIVLRDLHMVPKWNDSFEQSGETIPQSSSLRFQTGTAEIKVKSDFLETKALAQYLLDAPYSRFSCSLAIFEVEAKIDRQKRLYWDFTRVLLLETDLGRLIDDKVTNSAFLPWVYQVDSGQESESSTVTKIASK